MSQPFWGGPESKMLTDVLGWQIASGERPGTVLGLQQQDAVGLQKVP